MIGVRIHGLGFRVRPGAGLRAILGSGWKSMRGTQGSERRFGMYGAIISGNLGGQCSFSGLRGCCLTSNYPFSTVNFAAIWNLSQ